MPLWQHLANGRDRRAAGADDEHHQRRRACRQQRRPAGIHGAAGRLRLVRRSAARRHRDLPCAEVGAEGPRPEHGGRRRGRLRAGPALATRKRWKPSWKRSARPATRPAKTCCSAWTSPSSEFFENGKYNLTGEGKRLTVGAVRRLPRRLGRAVPDHHDRGRHGRGRLGRLEAADRAPRRQGAAGRRRPVRHQSEDLPARASTRASPTRS